MTPNELMKHLTDEGDPAHIAIIMYLDNLKTFQQGSATQHSAKNSIIQPFDNHDKLAGARSATAVDKKLPIV
jgi:hypothetical protein